MRYRFFTILLIVLVSFGLWAQTQMHLPTSFLSPIKQELKPFYAPSEGQSEDLLNGVVISVSKVDSPKPKIQQMMLFISGMHPRNCVRTMRKLSLYENYPQYISFIKESKYNEQTQRISMTIDHALLPFPMLLGFKIPRITKAGHYPFVFEDGFLKNLKGTILVQDIGNFCLLGMKVDWQGPETKIPNMLFEPFLQTVGKAGLEHLIRVSLF
jgi:hypothetical protein